MKSLHCLARVVIRTKTAFSLSADLEEKVPADGGARGSEHPCDHLWQEEQDQSLLPQLAQDQDPQDRRGELLRVVVCCGLLCPVA